MVIVKRKTNLIYPLMLIGILVSLIIFSKDTLTVAQESLKTWSMVIVPSLFIFLIITELLGKTGIIKSIGILLEPIMRPIFNVPGIGAFPFIVGLTSGYPAGAKIVKDLYKNKQCTKIEAERLLTFTNNCSPLFITGAVAVGLFNEPSLGIKLLVVHHISAIIVGIFFRFYKRSKEKNIPSTVSKGILQKIKSELSSTPQMTFSNLAPTLTEAIKNATSTLLIVGGFILIFSILLNILINLGVITFLTQILKILFIYIEFPLKLASPIIAGMVELTEGINIMSKITVPLKFSIATTGFILGFGGISVMFQIAGVLAGTSISIKPYIFAKLLQGIVSSIILYIVI